MFKKYHWFYTCQPISRAGNLAFRGRDSLVGEYYGWEASWHGGTINIQIVFTEGRLCLVCQGEEEEAAKFWFLLFPTILCVMFTVQRGWIGQTGISPDATSLHGAPRQGSLAVLWDEDFMLVSWPASIWPKVFYLNISKAPISAVLKCSIRYGLSLWSISVCTAEQLLHSNRGWSHLYI